MPAVYCSFLPQCVLTAPVIKSSYSMRDFSMKPTLPPFKKAVKFEDKTFAGDISGKGLIFAERFGDKFNSGVTRGQNPAL